MSPNTAPTPAGSMARAPDVVDSYWARDLLWYKTHLWQRRGSFRSDVNHPEPPNPCGGMLVATPGSGLRGPCTAVDLDLHGDTPF
ncbi:hypothetical protein E2C01_034083 [Portunus trituberculatus]|uniref:Uncharacterized protein n=1 Tax=Portunus trituberculatus TaxID=210409 RepID=A0A5B7F610_PORTR|nr:hypothetical protein [Portunus trituberculatus]